MLKNKKILITIGVLLLLVMYAAFIVSTNTHYLNTNPDVQDIRRNNSNQQTNSNGPESLEEDYQLTNNDLIQLESKQVLVREQDKIGVFEQERYLNLPKNFDISVFSTGHVKPRSFVFLNDWTLIITDSNLWTAKPQSGEVILIKDTDQDGFADEEIVIDQDLRTPHGIDLFKGDLYVGEEHQVVVYRGIREDGTYNEKETLITGLPENGSHVTRTVKVGPDEKIYVSIGSACNVCEEDDPRRAAIVRYNLDGTNEQIFATGLRNTVGFIFSKDRAGTIQGLDGGRYLIVGVDNGRDRIGDDIPPEEVNLINFGGHYGWPYCYGDNTPNPEYLEYADFCNTQNQKPFFNMQAHSAPLGIYRILEEDNIPSLVGNLVIPFHGSWNRTTPTGYKVVRLYEPTKSIYNFITGWLNEDGSNWGRPVDVRVNSKGEMFLTDDGSGTIYKITQNK